MDARFQIAGRPGYFHCYRCGKDKRPEDFYRNYSRDAHHKSRYHSGCKECRREASREYYKKTQRKGETK